MQVTVRILELCGPLHLPTGLQDYDGVRLYYSICGQIKGYTTIWNSHKALARKNFRYPDDFGAWLLLSNALFSPITVQQLEQSKLKKMLCDKIGLRIEDLDESYIPPPPKPLPPLSASIVLPTKDRPKDLARALERLMKHQTRVTHEIIVVDNNPASGLTAPVVARYPEVIYVAESRRGVGYARNTGVLAARGDVVIMTDDDIVVGEGWLDYLIEPFWRPEIAAVMGLVLPYELNTPSQELFEQLGGLNFGYQYRYYDKNFFDQEILPDIGRIGNTASSAFRYAIFADPHVGPFDEALGAGTPARGGGDTYHFYRALAAGYATVYQPDTRAFHKHRTTMAKLRKQIASFQCGYTAMLTRIIERDKDERAAKMLYSYLPRDKWNRLKQALQGFSNVPFSLLLMEIWGNLIGPFNLRRSVRRMKKLGYYRAEQFAEHMARREPLLLKEASANVNSQLT